MSLFKKLYITLSTIFLIVFSGYFIIDIKKNKEYLESELSTKTQHIMDALEINLKDPIKEKNNQQIESITNNFANKNLSKNIKIKASSFFIKDSDLINNSKDLEKDKWQIFDVRVDEKIGNVELLTSISSMEFELNALEENQANSSKIENTYVFIPNEQYQNKVDILFYFTAINIEGKKISTSALLNINDTLLDIYKEKKFDNVPTWFTNAINIKSEEKSKQIIVDWKTRATVYVNNDLSDAYTQLYEKAKSNILYGLCAFIIYIFIIYVFLEYILKPIKKYK